LILFFSSFPFFFLPKLPKKERKKLAEEKKEPGLKRAPNPQICLNHHHSHDVGGDLQVAVAGEVSFHEGDKLLGILDSVRVEVRSDPQQTVVREAGEGDL